MVKFKLNLTNKPLARREIFGSSAVDVAKAYLFSIGYRGAETEVSTLAGTSNTVVTLKCNDGSKVSVTVREA